MKAGKFGLCCSVAAITGLLSVAMVLPTTGPVQAQQKTSLFDVIFNRKARERRARNIERERLLRQHKQSQKKSSQAARVAKVSSPPIYTYKPDRLKAVDLTPLSTVQIASAEPVVGPLPISPFDEARRFLSGVRLTVAPEVGEALLEYYGENHDFVWVDGTAANADAWAAIAVLEQADTVGLSPKDYALEIPEDGFDMTRMADRQRELIMFEMNMSARVLAYVLDATRGRIDPNRLSGYHDFKRKDVDLTSAMSNLASTSDAGRYLRGSSPANPQFEALVAELAKLRAEETKDAIVIAKGTFLRPGTNNPELVNIVAAIRERGSDKLLVDHGLTLYQFGIDPSQDYTDELVSLVRDFQRENDLVVDGIVGQKTIAKLVDETNEDKVEKIELAMERLRWLPRDLGNQHVFINQPAYRATYVKDGKDALSMRAIVGKRSNQTSFFQDEIETVEYNPYWGVPRSIIVNEMLPKLRRDSSYLDRQGYELTDRRGRRVSSRNINWYQVGPNNIPVDVRQPPGAKNALGELKIMFPNKHAIYMHDTPSRELFEKETRAFSHGCVRLQDPWGMAAAVLGTSTDHVNQQIAKGHNLSEPVSGNIPVYVSYFTAWPDSDGAVGYFEDMYGRDAHLAKAIIATSKVREASS